MPAEDGPGPAAVPYCWDQCILPHGAGAGPTEEGVSCWLTRLKRHPGATCRHEVGRVLWATPTERRKGHARDLHRCLRHDLAAVGCVFGTSKRRFMRPSARECSPPRNGPIRAPSWSARCGDGAALQTSAAPSFEVLGPPAERLFSAQRSNFDLVEANLAHEVADELVVQSLSLRSFGLGGRARWEGSFFNTRPERAFADLELLTKNDGDDRRVVDRSGSVRHPGEEHPPIGKGQGVSEVVSGLSPRRPLLGPSLRLDELLVGRVGERTHLRRERRKLRVVAPGKLRLVVPKDNVMEPAPVACGHEDALDVPALGAVIRGVLEHFDPRVGVVQESVEELFLGSVEAWPHTVNREVLDPHRHLTLGEAHLDVKGGRSGQQRVELRSTDNNCVSISAAVDYCDATF